jgi:hypothetical protein
MRVLELYKVMASVGPVIEQVTGNIGEVWSNQWCITGGFTRDVLLGITPKDLDVCVDSPFRNEHVAWSPPSERAYEHGYVQSMGSSSTLLPVHTEFIHRSISAYPEAIIPYHSCGLSNAFWFNNKLVIDETFFEDVQDRVVRVSRKSERAEGEQEATNEYLKRIHSKLSDKGFSLELMR